MADLKKLKLKRRLLLNQKEEQDEDNEMSITDKIIMAEIEKKKKKGVQAIIWRDNSDRYRMLVCQKFLTGHCTLTTCPLAHPGVRDAAPVSRTNNDFILPPVDMSEPRTSYKPLFLYSFIPFSFYTFTLSPFHPSSFHPPSFHPTQR